MRFIHNGVTQAIEEGKKYRHIRRFVPAGQSTQMIVGATSETDNEILTLSSALYRAKSMRRVYYSGFVPVNGYDKRLPVLNSAPLVRENRLYQADWLMRFYQFKADEIVDNLYPNLDLEIDPKLAWALRHPEFFPIDINKADYHNILRIPGVGVKSAMLIVSSRKYGKLGVHNLKKMGVVLKRAQYFITCSELPMTTVNELKPEYVKGLILSKPQSPKKDPLQLEIPFTDQS